MYNTYTPTCTHIHQVVTDTFLNFCQRISVLMHRSLTWHVARRCWTRRPCVSARAGTQSVCCPFPCLAFGLLVCALVRAAPPPRLCSHFSACHCSDPALECHAARRYTDSARSKHKHSPMSAGKHSSTAVSSPK